MRHRLEINFFLPLSKKYSCLAKGYTGSLAALKSRPYICGPLDRTFSNHGRMLFIADHLVIKEGNLRPKASVVCCSLRKWPIYSILVGRL